jgi:hypothetical protein
MFASLARFYNTLAELDPNPEQVVPRRDWRQLAQEADLLQAPTSDSEPRSRRA